MQKCTVCQTENDPFATVCRECGGFLQNRIPNLNLFETIWGILESPTKTFKVIVMAEHKNFSLLLFTLFGIGVSFSTFWFYQLGNSFSSLPELLVVACLVGIGGGIVIPPIITAVYHHVARIGGRKATYKTGYAILAYSTTPVVLSVFLVLPIELLTFGMYLFTGNPDPYVIKPISYVALLFLDGVMGIWSLWLVLRGTTIAYGVGWLHSSLAMVAAVGGVLLSVGVIKAIVL